MTGRAALLARALFVLGVAAICFFSLFTLPFASEAAPGNDKVQHLLAYFLVTLIGCAGYRSPVQVALFMVAVGAGLEFVQGAFTDTRRAEWLDLAADAAGAGAAILLAYLAAVLRGRRA